jgi:hypothetical protein
MESNVAGRKMACRTFAGAPRLSRMTTSLFRALALGVICALAFDLAATAKTLSEKEKIEALIRTVEELSDAKFIRNGSEYDSSSAAKFLRRKWSAQSKAVASAQDFIQKVASGSSTSGKPYLIRFKDGKSVECGDYLKGELKRIEGEK